MLDREVEPAKFHQSGTWHPAFLARGASAHGNLRSASPILKRPGRGTSAELDLAVQTQGCVRRRSSPNRAAGEKLSPRCGAESATKVWARPASTGRRGAGASPGGRRERDWGGVPPQGSPLALRRGEQGPSGRFYRCAGNRGSAGAALLPSMWAPDVPGAKASQYRILFIITIITILIT